MTLLERVAHIGEWEEVIPGMVRAATETPGGPSLHLWQEPDGRYACAFVGPHPWRKAEKPYLTPAERADTPERALANAFIRVDWIMDAMLNMKISIGVDPTAPVPVG